MKEISVSDPQGVIAKSTCSLNLFLAGIASGKTFTSSLVCADFCINFPKGIGLIGANTYDQLSKSTLKNIFDSWYNIFGWVNGITYVVDKIPPEKFIKFGQPLKSYHNTICFDNGAMIFTASLDNYKAIDGIEIAWALLDETKDTREEAVKDVIMWRLRQKAMYVKDEVIYDYPIEGSVGYNPLYVFTSPAKVDWINEWFGLSKMYEEISRRIFSKTDFFIYKDKMKCVTISSTYHNEENLPKGFIESKLEQFKGSKDKIDRLIYGSPIAKTGGEFFNCFDRLKHVGKVPFLKDVNVHISLDFNVAPYITMTCWQIVKKEKGYQVRCFDEICLSSPKNNTEALCEEFKRKWQGKEALYYYGDASGTNRSTQSKEHNFDILERVLRSRLNVNSNRVLNRNPSVVATRDFMNKLLSGGHDIEIIIDDSCSNVIADFEFLKEDADGGKLKVRVVDKSTGQSYEKYGHTADSSIYLFVSAFNNLFEI